MNFSAICRICLENFIECVPLESPLICSEDSGIFTVDEIISSLSGIEPSNDKLPENICIYCTEKLKNVFEFIQQIKESHRTLLKEVLRQKEDATSNDKIEEILQKDSIDNPKEDDLKPIAIIKKDGSIEYKALRSEIPTKVESQPKPLHIFKSTCSLCGKSLTKSSLPHHMKAVHGQKRFRCTHTNCRKVFSTKIYLTKHLETHKARDRPFQCGTCPKSFYSKSHLIIHNKSHSNVTYSCEICGKSFYRQKGLEYHLKKHIGDIVKCQVCSKEFVNLSDLKVHMRFHSEDFPFKCELCPEKFNVKGHFTYHMKQHNGGKFKCSICSLEISLAAAFRRHVFSHTGKPYPCPVECCGNSFNVKSLLSNHMNMKHGRDLTMEELKFINTNFQVKLRSLTLPLNFDINEEE